MLEELCWWSGRDELAVDEDQEALGEGPGLGAVVDDYERRPAGGAKGGRRVLEQARASFGVEAGEGLVEQQDVGLHRQRPGDVNAAALAARQGACGPVAEVSGAHRVESGTGALITNRSRDAPPGEGERDVVKRCSAGEVGCLERDRDPAVTLDPSFCGPKRAGERVEQGALARAVGAEQRDELAGAEFYGDVADDRPLAANDCEVLAAKQRLICGRGVVHAAGRKRMRIPLP
jgi:hypothetical protein